ncbi:MULTISPECIES: hypothetical protein [unclassified Rhizobium]|uniref:hypothetical protein n=1 Tax=unclassified Rhizobium TaxID=2613769 RepID=UPI001C838C76|nr:MULTISPECIES: hypothetical protein [unclassified Rhizobium]MBX5215021.1 hypothetical protein [Rhizobium sp. NLR9a]MBX5220819.1 hypothetical protein [Rhizobium sp. NLR8a]MBX5244437.1 hypothetical protein [Rhizobium sp. NLR3b]MBX5276262.1 hypothetical protein [Rhizobium sp. NLR13a]MBX5282002.1 hypothetical protein [Rhizobium sp. NLR10a]
MEIFSLRSSQSLLFKNNPNNARNSKTGDIQIETKAPAPVSFHIEDNLDQGPDFTAVSPGELRNYARQSFDSGLIDQNTYAAISEPLPMHAIDPLGNIIDLSGVTDGTSFNFLDYYKNQLQVAMSIGDPHEVQTLKSIVSFLNA